MDSSFLIKGVVMLARLSAVLSWETGQGEGREGEERGSKGERGLTGRGEERGKERGKGRGGRRGRG